jgi:hypothetical protein
MWKTRLAGFARQSDRGVRNWRCRKWSGKAHRICSRFFDRQAEPAGLVLPFSAICSRCHISLNPYHLAPLQKYFFSLHKSGSKIFLNPASCYNVFCKANLVIILACSLQFTEKPAQYRQARQVRRFRFVSNSVNGELCAKTIIKFDLKNTS